MAAGRGRASFLQGCGLSCVLHSPENGAHTRERMGSCNLSGNLAKCVLVSEEGVKLGEGCGESCLGKFRVGWIYHKTTP